MTNIIVIGICVILLFAVVFVSIKPISMGIEARREKKDYSNDINSEEELNDDEDMTANSNLSEELKKLYLLRKEGALTDDEYQKAKNKLLS